jgi:hypothetical protein
LSKEGYKLQIICSIMIILVLMAIVIHLHKEIDRLDGINYKQELIIMEQSEVINSLNIELVEQKKVGDVLYDLAVFNGYLKEVE